MKKTINLLGKCTKRAFDTAREANRALKRNRQAGIVAVYQCSKCGKYHMTSMRLAKPKRGPGND